MIKRIAAPLMLVALFAFSALMRVEHVEAQFPVGFGAQRAPAIISDSTGKLYLMMSVATNTAEARTPGSQIFFTMSKNGGNSWDNEPVTRNLSNSDGEAFGPSAAVTRGLGPRPYVAYHDNSDGITQVYLLRNKKKAKFKKPKNITPHNGGAFTPRLAIDPNNGLNIVWGDNSRLRREVAFVRSTDEGGTFTDLKILSQSSGNAFDPEIAIVPLSESPVGFSINVVWDDTDPGHSVIMFSRSLDGGETFTPPMVVSRTTGDANEANIAVDEQGGIHVVWIDTSTGDPEAFYARSSDGGGSFSEPVNVSNVSNGEVRKPVIAAAGNKVFIAFNEDDNSAQVFLVTSSNGGQTFSDRVRVSNANRNIGRAHSASIAIDPDGTLHIVWIDSSLIGRDEGLLFYGRTTNGEEIGSKKMILAFVGQ
ncbi:MAG TPA: sialidase family protein [Blastocatellia bacterium]|nr:sialidase family protein [Blastocatellia bacterium]